MQVEESGVCIHALFIVPYYYPELNFGGPPKRLHSYARELRQRGIRIQVITFDSQKPKRNDRAEVDGVSIQYIPWTGSRLRQVPTQLHRMRLAMGSAHVVHCFGLYNLICPIATMIAGQLGKPLLLEPMGMFTPRSRSFTVKKFFNVTLTRWMARRASAVIATSDLEAVELKPLTECSQLVTRRNGIDRSEFTNLPPREITRTRWNIGGDQKLILYLGRISAKKRLVELVQAFDETGIPEARLVIGGPVSEPAYEQRLRQTIRGLPAAARISIVEPVYEDSLKGALHAADLFVLASENENFGNSAGEAVVADVPVLLTETCGIAPIIHRRAGLAVPLGVGPIVEGLRVMLDPQRRKEFMKDPEAVKRDLSWDEPIAQTIALYERIIAQSRKGKG